jgi:flagellar biosynthesis protein FlhG
MVDEEKKARRIAVISGKGGVGKTVITANLAAALSCAGHRVLVVDADLGLANLDVILDVAPQFTINDFIEGKSTLDKVLVSTQKGFDLLPAGSGLPEGTVLTPTLAKSLESLLSSLESRYDMMLFDAGAGIGDVVLFFANSAHEIVLVVTPEPTSLMDSYATIKVLNKFYKRTEFLLVVNQANPGCPGQIGASVVNHLQNVISKFIQSENQDSVRLHLVGTIPQDPAIPQAVRLRQLLTDASPEAPSTCLMNHLADHIQSRLAVSTTQG